MENGDNIIEKRVCTWRYIHSNVNMYLLSISSITYE